MAKLEQDTLIALIGYLKEHGYPESSLAIEWPAGKFRVDLAVVDTNTKEPIAIFELKNQKTKETEKLGKKQLANFLNAMGKTNVPAYLVYSSIEAPFEIQRVNFEEEELENGVATFSAESIPTFTTLRSSKRNFKIAETREEINRISDKYYFVVCGICAFSLILVLYGNLFKKLSVSSQDLVLIGATMALILLPFASKIKFLGLEFERLTKEEKAEK